MEFFSVITRLSAIVAGVLMGWGLSTATSAPQEAAVAAAAIAVAVIPYIMYRVLQLISEAKSRRAFELQLMQALEALVSERKGPAIYRSHET